MPRPKEFDRNEVLDKAMLLFWRKGYHSTSLQDLVEAMGINRFSLYDTFENKQNLFQTALGRYRETIIGGILAPLHEPEATIPELRTFFSRFAEMGVTPQGRMGCLICNTAVELAPDDDLATETMQSYLRLLTGTFEALLLRAQAAGELGADLDIRARAEYLAGATMGLFVYIKSGLSRDVLDRYVKTALRDF